MFKLEKSSIGTFKGTQTLVTHPSIRYRYFSTRSHYKQTSKSIFKKGHKDFPGGPVVKTLCCQCREHRFNPWSENEDPTCCQKDWEKKE